ncbi:protein SIEVE ELEMENT OCCLUSION B-like isoform X2 [Diospyros lotus]|nr:protein SIEVE ELEMENT OCCLUSION B-like isoform X2 [Diospyros lotus]
MVPNEDELMKQILAIHNPDGKEFDVQPLLDVVEDIIQHANGTWVSGKDDTVSQGDLICKLDNLPYDAIKKVSCEFSRKCSGAPNTIKVFQSLESYSWEAKAVITLAAFAVNYGSYCLIAQLYNKSNPFAKSVAFLQLSPKILKRNPLNLKFEELMKIVVIIFGLIKDIVKAKIQSESVYKDYLVKAVSLSILGIVACASQMMDTVGTQKEYKPADQMEARKFEMLLPFGFMPFRFKPTDQTEVQKLSDLLKNIGNTRSNLKEDLDKWTQKIEENFKKLKKLFEKTKTDNVEILNTLFSSKDNQAPLYNPSTNAEENLNNKLSGRYVMLYISSLEHTLEDEYSNLGDKYKNRSTLYEIVWIPIVDESASWNKEMEKKFKEIQKSMPWYSISDPSKLDKAVIKYIKAIWNFTGKSLLVVLDPHGDFVKADDVKTFWIWEKSVFVLESESTENKLEQVWKGTTIQLLQDTMDPFLTEWIDVKKYIFLFGGDDANWIQEFLDAVYKVAKATRIDYVTAYVGKNIMNWEAHEEILNEQVEFNEETLYAFGSKKSLSAFWDTLQGIWQKKMDTGESMVDETTMKDIETLLSFDMSGEGWAAVCRGRSPKLPKAHGKTIPDFLNSYADQWIGSSKQHLDVVDALMNSFSTFIATPIAVDSTVVSENFEKLKKLFGKTKTDNVEILSALVSSKDNQAPLYNPSTNAEEDLYNKLSGRYAMLYISSLEHTSEDEYSNLGDKYKNRSTLYEIVWIPIVDESTSWNEEMEKKFKEIQKSMPWYSISDPSKLDKAVIKYVKEIWNFTGKSLLVVLDPHGDFVKADDVKTFWIWEKSVFVSESDSTENKLEQVWKGTTIQLLQDTMDPFLTEWIDAKKYIFLFGGDDADWIQEFLDAVYKVAKATRMDYVTVYLGKNNMDWEAHEEIINERVEFNEETLYAFGLKKFLSAFWDTLQGLWQKKMDTGESMVDETTMKDIETLLSFDTSGEGWAAVCRGRSPKLPKAHGKTIPDFLNSYADRWKGSSKQRVDLVDALITKGYL